MSNINQQNSRLDNIQTFSSYAGHHGADVVRQEEVIRHVIREQPNSIRIVRNQPGAEFRFGDGNRLFCFGDGNRQFRFGDGNRQFRFGSGNRQFGA